MTTAQPSNASEQQLYNVLKRANLLQYYDTFIAQGGDDVQQLCEAGEDEFLEIMALVGMAAKPLHVRRLQKALQEWVANPVALEAIGPPVPGSISAVVRDSVSLQVHSTQTASSAVVTAPTWTPQAPSRSVSPADSMPSPSGSGSGKEDRSGSPTIQPVLLENQVQAIAMAANNLSKQLPYFEPKDLNSKKPVNREIQNLVSSAEASPNKIEELRKYAAIYGRFDSKRKNDRPMSLHEISVNEAAAQLCLHCPPLLTRREDLFPLARQVVRDSGYQYSKGHSRAADVVVSAKKGRLDPIFQRHFDTNFKGIKQEFDKDQQEQQMYFQERMSAAAQELASIRQHQEQVKAELVAAKEEEDHAQTQKLTSELESLTTQQLQVLQEHRDLINRTAARGQKSSKRKADGLAQGEATSGTSSPVSDFNNFNSLANATFDSLYAAIRNSKGTLFEEGLRIAQQYGMSDFALELQQLQSQRQSAEGNGDVDELNGAGFSALVMGSNSVERVLEQPFELKEIKPGFDSSFGDDGLETANIISPKAGTPTERFKGSTLRLSPSSSSSPGLNSRMSPNGKRVVENGVQTVEAVSRLQRNGPGNISKGDLKRKGDNLELLPSRPPSQRNKMNHSVNIV